MFVVLVFFWGVSMCWSYGYKNIYELFLDLWTLQVVSEVQIYECLQPNIIFEWYESADHSVTDDPECIAKLWQILLGSQLLSA